MESGCGWQGQERDPWFLVDEDLGDGLLPWQEGFGGEEVRLETSGRALISPGVLWLPKPPSSALALCCGGCWFLGVFAQVWVPLCQIRDENEQNPCRNAGPKGGAAPSQPTSITPRRCQGCSGSAKSPRNGLGHPQNASRSPKTEFDSKAIPKHGSKGFKATFPAGKEPGPGSWGSQKMS